MFPAAFWRMGAQAAAGRPGRAAAAAPRKSAPLCASLRRERRLLQVRGLGIGWPRRAPCASLRRSAQVCAALRKSAPRAQTSASLRLGNRVAQARPCASLRCERKLAQFCRLFTGCGWSGGPGDSGYGRVVAGRADLPIPKSDSCASLRCERKLAQVWGLKQGSAQNADRQPDPPADRQRASATRPQTIPQPHPICNRGHTKRFTTGVTL
jgi:hypothetical protein